MLPNGRLNRITGTTIARPADTTAYASGDLVANDTTAGSVTPFTFSAVSRQVGYTAEIVRAGLKASQALATNGTFRLHLFSKLPTVTAGDNSALNVASNMDYYLGYMEITLGIIGTGQGAMGFSSPVATGAQGNPVFKSTDSQALFGLLEARAAYAPTSAQTFTPFLDVRQY